MRVARYRFAVDCADCVSKAHARAAAYLHGLTLWRDLRCQFLVHLRYRVYAHRLVHRNAYLPSICIVVAMVLVAKGPWIPARRIEAVALESLAALKYGQRAEKEVITDDRED